MASGSVDLGVVPTSGGGGSGITALTGDVTASGTGSVAATVAFVAASSAASVHTAELLANAATATQGASTIVKRDANGLTNVNTQNDINIQIGSYQLVAADNGKTITMNSGSSMNLTVPASLVTGFSCEIIQLGVGQVTIVASGTTIHNQASATKLAGQYAACTIKGYAANTFITQGNMV